MANSPSLRILHISDLHFTSSPHTEDVWGKQKDIIPNAAVMLADDVVKKFINNLKNFFKEEKIAEDQRPKLVIVSGDLVERGSNPEEFDRAKKFLIDLAATLNIDRKRIFVVPGNHDVNWSGGVNLEDRFANYFQTVQEFSSPELTMRGGLKIHHEDLSSLVHDISLEVTLFISPTYSGVPDQTKEKIKQRVRELQEKLRRHEAGIDDSEIKEDFNLLDIAAIGADQRSQIPPSTNRDAIRIAVLHHHLLPDNQLEVSQFESVVDAGRMLDELIAKNYDLVLTGHRHNRCLVHLRNKNGGIDVYTSPSLFKGNKLGYTIIDVHSPTSSYYAALYYYDLADPPYHLLEAPPEDPRKIPLPQRLVRVGRLLPQVSEVCADITPPNQQEILLPVLEAVRDYTKSAKKPPFDNFFRAVWSQVSEDLKNIGQKRLVFRSPRIWQQWNDLIQLAQNTQPPEIRLVSRNDLDYWLTANNSLSDAGRYSEPLRRFQGKKVRILILDKPYFTYEEEIHKCVVVVKSMLQQGFRVGLVPFKRISDGRIMDDFGIIGNFAVSTFEGQVDFTRSLEESFNVDDLAKARHDWEVLCQHRVWDSGDTSDDIKDFLNQYRY